MDTDCSALTKIFGPKNDLGGCVTGRLNRWAAQLTEYDFTITHIKGASNRTCDNLSRLPVPPPGELRAPFPTGVGSSVTSTVLASDMSVKSVQVDYSFIAEEIVQSVACLAQLPDPGTVAINICKVVGTAPTAAWDILPLNVKDVAKATREDRVYGKLLIAVRSGNINKDDPDMKCFVSVFNDIYVEQDVLFYGARIIIPSKQQFRLLQELHMSHIGIVKMKEVARQYFWWPLISKQIEEMANGCEGCLKYRRKPAPAPLCPWPYPRRPMERVHIDFCEFRGKQLLIMVDAYSKYIWTHIMNNDTTSLKTLAILYGWFCERPGFPVTLVSDNGPQFTAKEFSDKMSKWGIKHILTPPYHPASNGLAERAVGTIKMHLKRMDSPMTPIELYVNLKTIQCVHGATPLISTGDTPFELISKAPVPKLFPQLQVSQQLIQEKGNMSIPKDKVKTACEFKVGDKVLVYNTQTKINSKGVIKDIKSKNSYSVIIDNIEKHISGDNMTLISNECNNIISNETLNDIYEDICSDTDSTTEYDSDDEIEYNLPNRAHLNDNRRKYNTMDYIQNQNILTDRLRSRV